MTSVLVRLRHRFWPNGRVQCDTRGSERNRRAALTGVAATVARFVQISTSLITVPLTLRYLGNERFGLWMTISSVLAMAAFADFGIGNGVLNTVAKAFGRDDMEEDCAEAFGTLYKGRHVGTFGDVGTFSFFGNKTITTGEGGMVITNDDTLHGGCNYGLR